MFALWKIFYYAVWNLFCGRGKATVCFILHVMLFFKYFFRMKFFCFLGRQCEKGHSWIVEASCPGMQKFAAWARICKPATLQMNTTNVESSCSLGNEGKSAPACQEGTLHLTPPPSRYMWQCSLHLQHSYHELSCTPHASILFSSFVCN